MITRVAPASAAGSQRESRAADPAAAGRVTTSPGASSEVRTPSPVGRAAGSGTGIASPGSTSRPTPEPAGTAKPQSSSRWACSAKGTGSRSACIRLTTSRRPSRSAATTKVCRAASVNPVFPPSVPG